MLKRSLNKKYVTKLFVASSRSPRNTFSHKRFGPAEGICTLRQYFVALSLYTVLLLHKVPLAAAAASSLFVCIAAVVRRLVPAAAILPGGRR
jgi:hypothetical protein